MSRRLFCCVCCLSYASWEARRLSRRMAEDHQLASTFLVEVHDAIANLPGATPAREKLLRKSLEYLNGLTRDAGEDPALHRALATAYEKFAELQAGAVGRRSGSILRRSRDDPESAEIREMLAKESKDPGRSIRSCEQLSAERVSDRTRGKLRGTPPVRS